MNKESKIMAHDTPARSEARSPDESEPSAALQFPDVIKVWPRDKQDRGPDPVAEVLGLCCQPWRLVRIAQLLRRADPSINTRAEAETASALHFLLKHAIRHGDAWGDTAEAELQSMAAALQQDASPSGGAGHGTASATASTVGANHVA